MDVLNKIADEWNEIKGDKDRWEYLLNHRDILVIVLDNDGTYVIFNESAWPRGIDLDSLPSLRDFDEWIGDSYGIHSLLGASGISFETV